MVYKGGSFQQNSSQAHRRVASKTTVSMDFLNIPQAGAMDGQDSPLPSPSKLKFASNSRFDLFGVPDGSSTSGPSNGLSSDSPGGLNGLLAHGPTGSPAFDGRNWLGSSTRIASKIRYQIEQVTPTLHYTVRFLTQSKVGPWLWYATFTFCFIVFSSALLGIGYNAEAEAKSAAAPSEPALPLPSSMASSNNRQHYHHHHHASDSMDDASISKVMVAEEEEYKRREQEEWWRAREEARAAAKKREQEMRTWAQRAQIDGKVGWDVILGFAEIPADNDTDVDPEGETGAVSPVPVEEDRLADLERHHDEAGATTMLELAADEEADDEESGPSSARDALASEPTMATLPNKISMKSGTKVIYVPRRGITGNDDDIQEDGDSDITDESDIAIDYSDYKYISAAPHSSLDQVLATLTAVQRGKRDARKEELMRTDSSRDPVCGNWQDSYTRLHSDMMTGRKDPRFVTYVCERSMNCGGLAERLLGMTSAFFFGLLSNRAFHAEWQSPVPVEVVFDSPNIDWSFDFAEPGQPFHVDELWDNSRDLDVINFSANELDHVFANRSWETGKQITQRKVLDHGGDVMTTTTTEVEPINDDEMAWDEEVGAQWVKFYSNRGLIVRSFDYEQLKPRLRELGLRPHSAFGCIMDYLFRPPPSALDFITSYTSLLTLPQIFSVGIQIRIGDSTASNPILDAKRNTLTRHRAFFNCARELAETYALPSQRVVFFLSTDSVHLREEALATLGDHLVVSGLETEHSANPAMGSKTQARGHANVPVNGRMQESRKRGSHPYKARRGAHLDAVHAANNELYIMSKTNYRIISKDSGFGKLAAFASRRPHSTVAITPPSSLNLGKVGKDPAYFPDCTREDAFVSFRDLAMQHTLG